MIDNEAPMLSVRRQCELARLQSVVILLPSGARVSAEPASDAPE